MIIKWREIAKKLAEKTGEEFNELNSSLWETSEVIESLMFPTTTEDLASAGTVFGFMTNEQREWMMKQHSDCPITDVVELTDEQMDLFCELVNVPRDSKTIPADIVLNETIPIEGLRLSMSQQETDRYDGVSKFTAHTTIDIRIFRDIVTEHIMKIHGELPPNQYEIEHGVLTPEDFTKEAIVVGSVTSRTWKNNDVKSIETCMVPIALIDGELAFVATNTAYSNNLKKLILDTSFLEKHNMTPRGVITDTAGRAVLAARCWYGIMLALLNPVFKLQFKHEGKVSDQVNELSSTSNKKSKRPKNKKAKYLRKIVVDTDPIEDIVFEKSKDGKVIHKKKLLWHVIGHWVHRGDKVFFRKGYWKGPLRYTKIMNGETDDCDIPQEREVIVNKAAFE